MAAPLLYGRWDAAAQAHAAAEPAQFATPATDGFYAGFEPDPTLPDRLAALSIPVLLVVGEYDIWPTVAAVRGLAALLGDADLVVQPSGALSLGGRRVRIRLLSGAIPGPWPERSLVFAGRRPD
jgi:pimeloyl-ACP methyl ester carboxylesterase